MLNLLAVMLATAMGPLPAPAPLPACSIKYPKQMPAAGRKSALDSLTFMVGGSQVKICYGRPAARGRTMIGGADVPYDTLWRTGANEPTTVFSSGPLTVAGVKAPAGAWSLYTVPGKTEWQVVVNTSISQWGKEDEYTAEVRSHEVGRGTVTSEMTSAPIEQFTIHTEPAGANGVNLVLEWENTKVKIPIVATQ
ncbi:MAG: DUF2911 domain-containing protein [Gemmatimonadota bacterium]